MLVSDFKHTAVYFYLNSLSEEFGINCIWSHIWCRMFVYCCDRIMNSDLSSPLVYGYLHSTFTTTTSVKLMCKILKSMGQPTWCEEIKLRFSSKITLPPAQIQPWTRWIVTGFQSSSLMNHLLQGDETCCTRDVWFLPKFWIYFLLFSYILHS